MTGKKVDHETLLDRRTWVETEVIKSNRVADIIRQGAAMFDVKPDQIRRDIAKVQKNWSTLMKEREDSCHTANKMTARFLLNKAINADNAGEARQMLKLVCELDNSFPSKDSAGALKGLMELARLAAASGGAASGAVHALSEKPTVQEVRVEPPPPKTHNPLDAALPTALRLTSESNEKALDPEMVKELANGRAGDGDAVIKKAKSGATRIYGKP